MDALAHCRAMAALCRQRVAFENENDAFWIREAEAQSLLLLMAFCQRLGAVFMARGGKGPRKACSYQLRALGLRRCCGYGALQFFVQVFLRVWIDGDVFSWKVAARPRLEG